MAFTGLLGGPLSEAGNVVPAFGGASGAAATLTGIVNTSVGTQYDYACGWDNGSGIINMVGYVLQEHQDFTETTDIQDNDRLIQIASPNSTDRFTFYPKVTQSDWSGGERQVIFVNANRFYTSQKLETSIPGHLFIYGLYQDLGAKPAGVGAVVVHPHNVAWNGQAGAPQEENAAHIACDNSATSNSIRVDTGDTPPTAPNLTAETIGPASPNHSTVQELFHAPDYVYASLQGGSTPGIYRYNGVSSDHHGTDQVMPGGLQGGANIGPMMTYFADSLYYVLKGSSPNKINQLTFANSISGGGAGAGVTALTTYNQEATIYSLGETPTGLFYHTMGFLWDGAYSIASFYIWDGAAAKGTLQGRNPVVIVDIKEVGGVTFFLCIAGYATEQPFLMALANGTLSVFDDYRVLPADFQAAGGANAIGNLDGDGTFLYFSYPGLNVKRYDLRSYPTVIVSDIGNPQQNDTTSAGHTVATSGGRLLEVSTATPKFSHVLPVSNTGTVVAGDSGYVITSYFDLGAPTTAKVFRSLEMELNASLGGGASIAVYYQLDNQTGFPNTLNVAALSNNNLIGYFPANTKASKIQFKIVLTASSTGTSPDIRSYSLNARLGRVWKLPTQIRRNLILHDGSLDAQSGRAQDKLANLLNAYKIAAGNVVLFIPSPTSSTGVEQVNAVLEDYEYKTPKPGPNFSEQGALDMEADITMTFVERI